jgi:hypothetical protein
MLASIPSQHLESLFLAVGNPLSDSTGSDCALAFEGDLDPPRATVSARASPGSMRHRSLTLCQQGNPLDRRRGGLLLGQLLLATYATIALEVLVAHGVFHL